jgi:hypothetical protein
MVLTEIRWNSMRTTLPYVSVSVHTVMGYRLL